MFIVKYSPTSHVLSNSHSQLLGFQIKPLSHTSLSTILYIHIYIYLLLQTFSPNLHSYLHVSCNSINLVSLVLDNGLNTLTLKFFITLGTQIFAYG